MESRSCAGEAASSLGEHERAKPGDGVAQRVVGDLGGHFPALRYRFGIRLDQEWLAWRIRAHATLPNHEFPGAPPAEMAVDPFENERRKVLDLKSEGALDAYHQGGGRAFILAGPGAARPFERDRLAELGQSITDDIGPGEHHIRGRKTARGERLAECRRHEIGEGTTDVARLTSVW